VIRLETLLKVFIYCFVIGVGIAVFYIRERYGRLASVVAFILLLIVISISVGFHERDGIKAIELLVKLLFK
jgi:hypothetical protein